MITLCMTITHDELILLIKHIFPCSDSAAQSFGLDFVR